jgi:hypothetical protein
LLDKIPWRLVLEEGEEEDQAGENDVETGRDFLHAVSASP